MTGTNEQLAEERITSRLPLRVSPSAWKTYRWLLLPALLSWNFTRRGPDLFMIVTFAAYALFVCLLTRHARSKGRVVGGFPIVATEHEFRFGSEGSMLPYFEIRKIERYTNSTVWMYLHNGQELSFSIAGLSKEDRPLLVTWLQERIGADIFA